MSYNREVYEKVLADFSNKRAKAGETLAARKVEIYEKLPEVLQIDKKLRHTSVKLSMAVFTKSEDEVKAAIERLKRENLDLQAQKAEALVSAGYPYDYLTLPFECPVCKDEGYIGRKMCRCFREALIKEAYFSSNMAALVEKQNFNHFSLSYFSEIPDEATGISPKKNMERILRFAKNYVASFDPSDADSLLFIGQTGLGKTFLSSCIAKEIMDKGYSVIYDTAQNVFDNFEKRKFGREDTCSVDPDKYLQCDLLILDDLGAEYNSPLISSFLYHIINSRSNIGKPMIASTNLLPPDIERVYSSKTLSRIMGEFITLYFIGSDIRQQMLETKMKERASRETMYQ